MFSAMKLFWFSSVVGVCSPSVAAVRALTAEDVSVVPFVKISDSRATAARCSPAMQVMPPPMLRGSMYMYSLLSVSESPMGVAICLCSLWSISRRCRVVSPDRRGAYEITVQQMALTVLLSALPASFHGATVLSRWSSEAARFSAFSSLSPPAVVYTPSCFLGLGSSCSSALWVGLFGVLLALLLP